MSFRTELDRLRPIRAHYFDDMGLIGDKPITNANKATLAAQNDIAIVKILEDAKRLGIKELRAKKGSNYAIGSSINLSDYAGIDLIFEGSLIVPATTGLQIFTIYGNAPSSGWQTLSADRLSNAFSITTSDPIVGAVKGSWITVKSNATLQNGTDTYEITRKVVAVSGSTYTFEVPLEYDFFTADSAQAGLADVLEPEFGKWRVIAPACGDDEYEDTTGQFDFTRKFNIGLNIRYANNFILDTPYFQGTKDRTEAEFAGTGKTAIKFYNVFNSDILYPTTKDIKDYGVAILGASHDILVKRSYGNNCRHAWDLTDAAPGEPRRVIFDSPTAINCSLSGGSTHKTGREISILNAVNDHNGWFAGSDGMIIRNEDSFIQGGGSNWNTQDGIKFQAGTDKCIVENHRSENNTRDGFNSVDSFIEYNGCHPKGNSGGGFHLTCGNIIGGSSKENAYAVRVAYDATEDRELLVAYLDAPYSSGKQTVGVLIPTNYDTDKLTLNSNKLIGYNDFVYQVPSGLQDNYMPRTNGLNQIHKSVSGGKLVFKVTLSAGASSAISTTSVRRLLGASSRGRLISNIKFDIITASNAGAHWAEIADGSSFTVYSTNTLDASVLKCTITGF